MQITDKLATVKAYQAAGFTAAQAEAMAEQHEEVAEEIHQQLTKAMTEAISGAIQPLYSKFETFEARLGSVQARLEARLDGTQANVETFQARLEAAIARATAEQTRFTIAVGAIIVGILGLMMTAYRFFQ